MLRDDHDAGRAGRETPVRDWLLPPVMPESQIDLSDFPFSVRIHSEDLDDDPAPAFYRPPAVDIVFDTADLGGDDPEELRAKGPAAVGSALYRLAEEGLTSLRREVRQAARLLLEYLSDGLHHDSMDFDIGLRPRNGSPDLSLISRRAERDRLVVALSREEPWAGMGPTAAASALKEVVAVYEVNRWPRECPPHRKTAPAGEPNATAWRILRLALPQGPMPSVADLARMIKSDRQD